MSDKRSVGYGLTFTCGRGTEIVLMATRALSRLVTGRNLRNDIFTRFGQFWRELTSESQMRWVSFGQWNDLWMVSRELMCHRLASDWTGKGCYTFGCGRHYKRIVGFVGSSRTDAAVEIAYCHGSRGRFSPHILISTLKCMQSFINLPIRAFSLRNSLSNIYSSSLKCSVILVLYVYLFDWQLFTFDYYHQHCMPRHN